MSQESASADAAGIESGAAAQKPGRKEAADDVGRAVQVKPRRPRKEGPAVVGTPGVTAQARTGIRAGTPNVKTSMKPGFRPVAIIPVYNQPQCLAEVVADVRKLGLPVYLVDDGSDETTRSLCDRLAEPGVRVIHRTVNGGKGAAVIDGFKVAGRAGYTHALQIDADGQHDRAALPKLLALGQKYPCTLICGYPVYDETVPKARLFGRKLTNFWAAVNSLSLSFEDAMCGLRLYPLDPVLGLVENAKIGRRMEFDPEILVRLLWAGVRIKNIPVRVTYPAEGVSHFNALTDNVRISLMHAKLCVLMLTRLPIILFSRICGRDPECKTVCPDAPLQAANDKTIKSSKAAKPAQLPPANGTRAASVRSAQTAGAQPKTAKVAKAPAPSAAAQAAALAQAQAEVRRTGISQAAAEREALKAQKQSAALTSVRPNDSVAGSN